MNCSKKPILLFETIKVSEARFWHIKYHQRRADLACGGLKFDIEKVLQNAINEADSNKTYRAKLIYDTNGDFKSLELYPYTPHQMYKFRLVEVDFEYGKKYLDRSKIDEIYAQKGDCDDIIMIKNHLITDTSIANVAIYIDEWLTPRTPLLAGTTRARLIDSGFLKPSDININMLKNAQKFAVMNAMLGFKELHKFSYNTTKFSQKG